VFSVRRAVPFLTVAAALAFTGCGGYQPGSLTVGHPAGEVRRVGCLDIAVEPVHDAEAVGPVAGITFANRCDAAVRVDLASIRAVGELADGRRARLAMFDPDDVVRPGELEARRSARENIEFQLPEAIETVPARLCLDLAGVDPAAAIDQPIIACVPTGIVGPVAEVPR
jgi:hypothetical protein